MPTPKRSKTRQDWQTPPELLVAVANRFGPICFDLAASGANVVPGALGYFDEDDDALRERPWVGVAVEGEERRTIVSTAIAVAPEGTPVLWLNPPYARCDAFSERCASELPRLRKVARDVAIVMLVPASVGAVWWERFVHGVADQVDFIRPRVQFVGAKDGYPKDLALVIYRPATWWRRVVWALRRAVTGTLTRYVPWRWEGEDRS